MKSVTVTNYRDDSYYNKVVVAFTNVLKNDSVVTPISILVSMNLLRNIDVENWRHGRIPYLEKCVQCNLSKVSRILRIIHFHAHDLNMIKSMTVYKRINAKGFLRFTKTGESNLEKAYSTLFFVSKKQK